MTSSRPLHHKRRSYSVSSPATTLRRSSEHPWRASTKRSHLHAFPLDTELPSHSRKRGVDAWKSTKRRRNFSTSPETANDDRFSIHLRPPGVASSSIPAPSLAATAAEFNLFPNRHGPSNQSQLYPSTSDMSTLSDAAKDEDLQRLRSDAFGTLHRSVAESGEGLVHRMRDYEHWRIGTDPPARAAEAVNRGRQRSSLPVPVRYPSPSPSSSYGSEEEEDDVQFIDGNSSSPFSSPSSHRKHASSPELMDVDMDADFVAPKSTSYRSWTTSRSSHTPALSHSTSSVPSPASSVSGLPPDPSMITPQSPRPLTLSATRSEKALAALTLAMTNGAGSINEYDALGAMHPISSPSEDSLAGELWQ